MFASPMIIGNIFQQFYHMVDAVTVGRFVSQNALAAVGACYSVCNVFLSVSIGGGIGASVITSRHFGERDYTRMKNSVSTALFAFFAVSVILGIIGFFAGKEIMRILKVPDNILDDASLYTEIFFLGLPFLFIYNILASMFNAIGQSRTPLYLLIFSSVLNIFLDLYTVIKLDMGVAGVAWATLIAQGISAVFAFVLLLRAMKRFHSPHKAEKLFDGKELSAMSRIAFPSIFQQSTVAIGMMLVQSVVNSFGAERLAGFSAAMRVEAICVVPMAAMGNAMSPFAAQNIGARKPDRVHSGYKTAVGIVFFSAFVICAVLELFKLPIIKFFLGSEGTPTAFETGTSYLEFMGFFFVVLGLKMTTDGMMRGAGVMTAFTIGNFVNLGIRVFIASVFAPIYGIQFVWYAVPFGWAANFLITFSYYKIKMKGRF